jgi:acetate---CoA ligase (ADP-forming)
LRGLELIHPKRIAIVGASRDPSKMGGRVERNLKAAGYPGRVYRVNPREASGSADTVASLADLPEPVDVAVMAVPKEHVVPALLAGEGMVANAVILAAGFNEIDPNDLDSKVLTRLHHDGMGILGPNLLGLYVASSSAVLTFSPTFDGQLGIWKRSGLAIVSQSGAFGGRFFSTCARDGVTIDSFISTGNELGYQAADILEILLASPERPNAVFMYLESIRDGLRMERALLSAGNAGTHVVVLCSARTTAGFAAAQSHTAAIAANSRVASSILRYYGAVVVDTDTQLFDAALAYSQHRKLLGSRVGVITGSGGAGVLAADLLFERDLTVPTLSDSLRNDLAKILPAFGSTRNPVDMTADIINNPGMLASVLQAVGASGEVDGIVVAANLRGRPNVAADVHRVATPIVFASLDASTEEVREFTKAGLVVFPTVARAVDALQSLASADIGSPRVDLPHGMATPMSNSLPNSAAGGLEVIQGMGIPVARWALAKSLQECVRATQSIGFPVVLKANVPSHVHKSAGGLVKTNLKTLADVDRLAPALLTAGAGVIVQEQLAGTEFLVGVLRHESMGYICMFGLGGRYAEAIGKVVIFPVPLPAPAIAGQVSAFLDRIEYSSQARGLPEQLAHVIELLIQGVAVQNIGEIEINPLIVYDGGIVALDCRIIG